MVWVKLIMEKKEKRKWKGIQEEWEGKKREMGKEMEKITFFQNIVIFSYFFQQYA